MILSSLASGCTSAATPVTSAGGTPQPVSKVHALVGATLLDGTGAAPVADAAVILDGDRIACAGTRSACPVPAGATVVDVSGQWITPGLVDAHVHFSQTAWVDGRPDFVDVRDRHPYDTVQAQQRANPERIFQSFLCSGVTAVFDVGGYPWTWDLRDKAEQSPRAPHVAAAGPLVTHTDHPLTTMHPPSEMQFVALTDPEAGRRGVRYLHANRSDAVKIWFLRPTPEQQGDIDARYQAVGDEARKLGIPLIAHATLLREATIAVQAGASLLVHDVRDAIDDGFIALLKERGTIYAPTLVVSHGYQAVLAAAISGKPPVLDDPHGCVDAESRARIASSATLRDRLRPPPEGMTLEQVVERRRRDLDTSHQLMRDNLRRIHAAGVPIAMGTDAGNPLTLFGPSVHGAMEAMQLAGMAPMDVLVASTRNSARAMGREADLGTIEAGKFADLLVIGADPGVDIANMRQLRAVWRAGVNVVSHPPAGAAAGAR